MELSNQEFLWSAITSGHDCRRASWLVVELGRICVRGIMFDERGAFLDSERDSGGVAQACEAL